MKCYKLDSLETLSEIIKESFDSPIVLFKHSTRCSISSLVLGKITSQLKNVDMFILDIIAHRDISDKVAQQLNVIHQSPQLFIIYQGKCYYNTSHFGIKAAVVQKQLAILK